MGKAVSKALGTSQAQCDTYGFWWYTTKKALVIDEGFFIMISKAYPKAARMARLAYTFARCLR